MSFWQLIATADTSSRFHAKNPRRRTRGTSTEWAANQERGASNDPALLTVFDIQALICSDRGTQFVGAWFRTMCKYMGVRLAKTVAYHSRSNGGAQVAGMQLFEKIRQLHIEEGCRNWYKPHLEGSAGIPQFTRTV